MIVVAPYVEHVVSKSDSEIWNECLGKALAKHRADKGWTQDDLAKMLGKTRRTVSDIETGKAWNNRLINQLIFDVYGTNPAKVHLIAYAIWKSEKMPIDIDLDDIGLS